MTAPQDGTCPNCGVSIADSQHVCPHCGQDLSRPTLGRLATTKEQAVSAAMALGLLVTASGGWAIATCADPRTGWTRRGATQAVVTGLALLVCGAIAQGGFNRASGVRLLTWLAGLVGLSLAVLGGCSIVAQWWVDTSWMNPNGRRDSAVATVAGLACLGLTWYLRRWPWRSGRA